MTKFLSDQWMMDRDLLTVNDDVSESHWYAIIFQFLIALIILFSIYYKGGRI